MSLDVTTLIDRYWKGRARTRAMFDLLDEAAYYSRPIKLRNPIVFYEGHVPAFAVNTLVKNGLGRTGIDERLETVFARGIDPEDESVAVARGNPVWPDPVAVRHFVDAADALVADSISQVDFEDTDPSMQKAAEAVWTLLEHEEMHQETLAYMWHQLPLDWKRKPESYLTAPPRLSSPGGSSTTRVRVPAGPVTLGTKVGRSEFGWDNERPEHRVRVEAFEIDVHDVTNADFLAFVDAGGYRESRWWRPEDWAWVRQEGVSHPGFWERLDDRWFWRGMFERVELPEHWPVYVTWAEANAFARWRGGRLPNEAEFQRVAYGTLDGEERHHPWGSALRGRPPANLDFARWDPEAIGARPEGRSAFGVHDLVGNGWEWTSTVFGPFDGFEPLPSYPEYSADFFDGDHFVMKGASPVTAQGTVRPGFRNWFRPRYPYVYATFRCVGNA